MKRQSAEIESNQTGPHDKLAAQVARYRNAPFQRPIAVHSRKAFDDVQSWLSSCTAPLVLDACCGVGESTRALARRYPDCAVIGVDKSDHRLTREGYGQMPNNAFLVRADLVDFYRLAHGAGWRLQNHFLLYPNPWPKAEHLKRRWHAMPVFPYLLALGGVFEVRSNWQIYVEEMALALGLWGVESQVEQMVLQTVLTPFERKYADSGHRLWRVRGKLSSAQIEGWH